jgi:DNA-binding response OmpR family regulator
MKNILIVDDEQNIRILLRDFLELEGFAVAEATDGREALEMVSAMKEPPDLIILDVMLPAIDGYAVCKAIKRAYDVPVIILSARSDEFDEAHGFEVGADDYVAKPIKPTALVARIKALFRRLGDEHGGERGALLFDGLALDDASHTVTLDGETIALSPKEYDLLMALARNSGRVISREALMNSVWGYEYYGGLRTVDTHINRLRAKLSRKSGSIVTVRSFGYKFEG